MCDSFRVSTRNKVESDECETENGGVLVHSASLVPVAYDFRHAANSKL